MLLLDCRSKPRGLNLAGLDTRVLECLEIGFDHQLFGTRIPPLAKFRATHPEDRDLVFDAGGHSGILSWSVPSISPTRAGASRVRAAVKRLSACRDAANPREGRYPSSRRNCRSR